jgi:hypothetical protein
MSLEVTSNSSKYHKSTIIYRLINKLMNHAIDHNKLFEIMQEKKVYMSGSYLLQSICDNDFNHYDLDLFVFGDRDDELESQIYELFKNNYKDDNNYFYNVHKDTHENKSFKMTTHYSFRGIKSVSTLNFDNYNYTSNYKNLIKMQIIYIDKKYYSDMKSFVNDYDLDICSNYYDGGNCENLYIKNLSGIVNKVCEFKINNVLSKEEQNEEYLKYCKKISEYKQKPKELPVLYNYDNLILTDRNLSRINKYVHRGFNIKINFDDNEIFDLINKYNTKTENNKVVLIINCLEQLKLINDLPSITENILVYYHQMHSKIFNLTNINLPPILKEIRFFNLNNFIGSPKIPFGCEIYFDNKKSEKFN